jgi:hypothetical protein
MPTSSITINKIFGVLDAVVVEIDSPLPSAMGPVLPSPHPLSCKTAKITLAHQEMSFIISASGFF